MKHIDDTVNQNLTSEREYFVDQLTNFYSSENKEENGKFNYICNHLIDKIEQCRVSSPKNKAQTSTLVQISPSIAKQLATVSQVHQDFGALKASVLNIINSYLKVINQVRIQMKTEVVEEYTKLKTLNDQYAAKLQVQEQASHEKDKKMAEMEQQILDLAAQVDFYKKQASANPRVIQLEKQVADKSMQMDKQKESYEIMISQLEQEIEEKTEFFEQQKKASNEYINKLEQSLNTQPIQEILQQKAQEVEVLQSQIEEKDQLIQEISRNSASKISQLESKLEKEKNKSQMLKDSVENLKQNVSQMTGRTEELGFSTKGSFSLSELRETREEEIDQLKTQVTKLSSISHDYDTLRVSYLKKSKDIDELRHTTELVQRRSLELEEQNQKLKNSLQAYELKLSHSSNEHESLESDCEHALLISNIRKNKIIKLKADKETMRAKIAELQKTVEELNKRISDIKFNSEDAEHEISLLKQQIILAEKESQRSENLYGSMKEKVNNLESLINEKDKVIKSMQINMKKKDEELQQIQNKLLESHTDISNIQTRVELINKSKQLEAQQEAINQNEEHIKKLNESLCKSKATAKSLSFTNQQLNERIVVLESKIEENKTTILQNEAEILRLLDLTAELTKQKALITEQNDNAISESKEEKRQMKAELESYKRKIVELTKSLETSQKALTSREGEINLIHNRMLELETGNIDITTKLDQVEQLKIENTSLRQQNAKITNEKQNIHEENINLTLELADLKRQSTNSIQALETRIKELQSESERHTCQLDKDLIQLQTRFNQTNKTLLDQSISIDQFSAAFAELSEIFQVETIEEIIDQASFSAQENTEMKSLLQASTLKIDELEASINQSQEMNKSLQMQNQELTDELNETAEQLNQTGNSSTLYDQKVQKLKKKLTAEKEEHETTKLCFEQFCKELATLKDLIPFDTIEGLKTSIQRIVNESNEKNERELKADETIRDFEIKLAKVNKDFNDQQKVLTQTKEKLIKLTHADKENKSIITRITQEARQKQFTLETELQSTRDKLIEIQNMISKLHSVIQFKSEEDFYFSILKHLQEKEQVIEDQKYLIKNLELSGGDQQVALQSWKQRINEIQTEMTKLKNEKLDLKQALQVSEKEIQILKSSAEASQAQLDSRTKLIHAIEEQTSITLEEFPSAYQSMKDEIEHHKTKNKTIRQRLATAKKHNDDLDEEIRKLQRDVLDAKQEKKTLESKIKRKEIQEAHIFGLASLSDLPSHVATIQSQLEQANNDINILDEKYSREKKRAEQLEHDNFQKQTLIDEMTTVRQVLEQANDELKSKNKNLEQALNSTSELSNQLKQRVDQLEAERLIINEKNQQFDDLISTLNKIIDFEDIDSLVTVVKDILHENKETSRALQTGQDQVDELLAIISDLHSEHKAVLPLSNSMMRDIKETLYSMSTISQTYRSNTMFIIRQAKNYGYLGEEVGGALEFIQKALIDSKANKEEAIKSKEEINTLLGKLESTATNMETLEEKVTKLKQVKDNLILLKAGDLYDTELLKAELKQSEISKLGLVL